MDGQISDFGVIGTQDLQVAEGGSSLFADDAPTPIVEKQPEPEEEVEDKPQPKSNISFTEPTKSTLFEEDDEVEVNDEPEPDIPQEPDEPETSPYIGLAEDLINIGIFSEYEDDEEKVETPEQLKAKFEREKIKGANEQIQNFLSKFGPKHIDAFNAIFVKGADPEVYYQKQAEIESYQNADIEDIATQEKVVKALYKKKFPNWSEERLNKKIENLKTVDDLQDEAEAALEFLVSEEKASIEKQAEESRKALEARQYQEKFYKDSINELISEKLSKKEFDGIPVTNKFAAEVNDFMLTKKWENKDSGETFSEFDMFLRELKDPKNYETALKIAMLARNNFDFSKIKSKAISEETKELFKSVHTKQKQQTKRSPNVDFFTNF